MPERSPIDVSILVVSFNTRDLTRAALDSIAHQTRGLNYEIVAVDNASTDGSAEMLRNHPANPRVIALDTNIGFARANNLAAGYAAGRYLLLLNPDTLILDNAIAKLAGFAARNPAARIWGGRTLFEDGSLNPSSCWRRMTPWNLFCRAVGLAAIFKNSERFNSEAYGGWDRSSVRQIDTVSGCFLLIERAFWNRLEGFDPLFFMYGEDADLCLRARKLGARPMMTPDATIVHYGGASEPVRADKLVRLLAAKSALIARHWPPLMRPVGRLLNAAWPLSRRIATAIAAGATRNSALREAAAAWAEVWQRRAEWKDGYPTAASSADVPRILVPSIP